MLKFADINTLSELEKKYGRKVLPSFSEKYDYPLGSVPPGIYVEFFSEKGIPSLWTKQQVVATAKDYLKRRGFNNVKVFVSKYQGEGPEVEFADCTVFGNRQEGFRIYIHPFVLYIPNMRRYVEELMEHELKHMRE